MSENDRRTRPVRSTPPITTRTGFYWRHGAAIGGGVRPPRIAIETVPTPRPPPRPDRPEPPQPRAATPTTNVANSAAPTTDSTDEADSTPRRPRREWSIPLGWLWCLIPAVLLLGGLAALDGDDDPPAQTSAQALVDTPAPQAFGGADSAFGPINLPPPWGNAPRTDPVSIVWIVDPELATASTTATQGYDELLAAGTYLDRYRIDGDRFLLVAAGPDAASEALAFSQDPASLVASKDRHVVGVGAEGLPILGSGVSSERVPASGDPATLLSTRGELAEALARHYVAATGAGWSG
ncbi:MAG: hypothetical protein GY788_07625 [bacterium]|nr:hypothetical protein [bacterium]